MTDTSPARVTLTDDVIDALAETMQPCLWRGAPEDYEKVRAELGEVLTAREAAVRAQIQSLHDHADQIADQRNAALADLAVIRAQIKADLLAARPHEHPEFGYLDNYGSCRDCGPLTRAARIAGGEQA